MCKQAKLLNAWASGGSKGCQLGLPAAMHWRGVCGTRACLLLAFQRISNTLRRAGQRLHAASCYPAAWLLHRLSGWLWQHADVVYMCLIVLALGGVGLIYASRC